MAGRPGLDGVAPAPAEILPATAFTIDIGPEMLVHASMESQFLVGISNLERETGRTFGGRVDPLLVSIVQDASGHSSKAARAIRMVGLNDDSVRGLEEASGDAVHAWRLYCGFIQDYSLKIGGLDRTAFDTAFLLAKADAGVALASALVAEDWQLLSSRYKAIVKAHGKTRFPQNAADQLLAVLCRWSGEAIPSLERPMKAHMFLPLGAARIAVRAVASYRDAQP